MTYVSTNLNSYISRVFEVQLLEGAVTKVGISALSALPELREFIFWNEQTEQTIEQFYLSKSLKYLPCLHVLGCRLSPDDANFTKFSYNLTEVLQEMNPKFSSLQLQQVALYVHTNKMPIDMLFPQLKVLHLVGANGSFGPNAEFSQLTKLSLKGVMLLYYIPLLDRVGHQLHSLSVCIQFHLQLEKALNLCPNLEELHLLPYSQDSDNKIKVNVAFVERLHPLLRMRVLNIATSFTSKISLVSTLLLAMPNLHSLRLALLSGPLMEMMDEIVLHLQDSTILQNLRSLIAHPQKGPLMQLAVPKHWDSSVKDYEAIVILHCPYLHDLDLKKERDY